MLVWVAMQSQATWNKIIEAEETAVIRPTKPEEARVKKMLVLSGVLLKRNQKRQIKVEHSEKLNDNWAQVDASESRLKRRSISPT